MEEREQAGGGGEGKGGEEGGDTWVGREGREGTARKRINRQPDSLPLSAREWY